MDVEQDDLRVEVWKKSGKSKQRRIMENVFTDWRCNEAIEAFVRRTEVGPKRRCDEVDRGGSGPWSESPREDWFGDVE